MHINKTLILILTTLSFIYSVSSCIRYNFCAGTSVVLFIMLLAKKHFIPAIRMCSTSVTDTEVLFEVKQDVGFITLNRPRVLNSLNENMVKMIYNKLKEWERTCYCVIVQGAGKAFCAGGDVVAATKNKEAGKSFFRNEYKLNYLIGNYRIPYISILDGVTMGGGVGISVHGQYRIATENTLFAMPETAIGLFPDVGGSFVLPRLTGRLGLYLGLTGLRLQGADVVNVGIATHFVSSKDIPQFIEKFLQSDPYSLSEFMRKNTVDVGQRTLHLGSQRSTVEAYFGADTMEDILTELWREGSMWSKDTAGMLERNSPTALKVTKMELELGSKMDLKDCLKMEYRLACAALDCKISPDFYEGE